MSSTSGKDKTEEKVVSDPDDKSRVRTARHGVYDYWEDISPGRSIVFNLPFLSVAKPLVEAYNGWPLVKRMVADITGIDGCMPRFVLWLLIKLALSLIPAVTLWYTGQLLAMLDSAVETRTVDKEALLRTAGGRILAPLVSQALADLSGFLQLQIVRKVDRHYETRAFRTLSKMDLPTFKEATKKSIFEAVKSGMGWSFVTWHILERLVGTASTIVDLVSTFSVLVSVLRGHSEAIFFLASNLARLLVDSFSTFSYGDWSRKGIFAFKTADDEFVHSAGMKKMVNPVRHRKDIVAGGIGDAVFEEYQRCQDSVSKKLGGARAMLPETTHPWLTRLAIYLRNPVEAMGQVYTVLKVIEAPSSAPFSLATLQLINTTMSSLNNSFQAIRGGINELAENVDNIRFCYRLLDYENKIPDGTVPFPENQADVALGISIEFKNVSFSYSEDGEKLALKNVSFKVDQGQLCVIVGENGSGKSTILSLISRIYDITEGEILVNGYDIRTLKLADLRKAVAVLDQSYSIFPVTLATNIGFGDPRYLADMDKIQQAAKLGGADEFIEALPYKYGTFTERPVWDYCNDKPLSTSAFAGKKVDFSKLKLNAEVQDDLSGGQKQRIALARTFMKSVVSPDNGVGLLLFDEPSASLDPKAEHDLFSRLRELRGNKTMIFSSHRFGKLTRHADAILYVDKGQVIEAGNHVELMKKGGEYAKFWNLQAEDFL